MINVTKVNTIFKNTHVFFLIMGLILINPGCELEEGTCETNTSKRGTWYNSDDDPSINSTFSFVKLGPGIASDYQYFDNVKVCPLEDVIFKVQINAVTDFTYEPDIRLAFKISWGYANPVLYEPVPRNSNGVFDATINIGPVGLFNDSPGIVTAWIEIRSLGTFDAGETVYSWFNDDFTSVSLEMQYTRF